MKNTILGLLLLVVFGELVVIRIIREDAADSKVLSLQATSIPIPTMTPSPTPTEIPTPVPTKSPTPKPTKTPTPIPQPTFSSQEINGLIDRFAAQYGVSSDVLRYIALCESGFDQMASNAGYAGLYQFGVTAWKNLRKEFGEDVNPDLRYNAEEAVQTAAYAVSENKGGIWPNCLP